MKMTDTAIRELTDHKVNPANDNLKIEVIDAPGSGGASHLYRITGFNTAVASKERTGSNHDQDHHRIVSRSPRPRRVR